MSRSLYTYDPRMAPNYVHGSVALYWQMGLLVVALRHRPPTRKAKG